MSPTFRWLGAAGVALRAGGLVLAIDPFFTRPGLSGFIKPITPDASLVEQNLPECQVVLVTHSHWDHVMDVPGVVRHTGAVAYGSANTCQILRLHGIPEERIHEVKVGERLSLGAFKVEVIDGQHSRIPFGRLFNGPLDSSRVPPMRLQDYRLDTCLGYRITVMGMRVLVCAAQPQPAEVMFAVAQESKQYYQQLLHGALPHTFIPIHWDNFMRPLTKPLRRFTRPGRMHLWQIARLARNTVKGVTVIIPEIFKEYTLGAEVEIER